MSGGDGGLEARVARLHAAYVHAIDDDRLEDWPELFAEDGRYRIVTRENRRLGLPLAVMYCEGRGMLRDRVAALRTANVFEPHAYRHVTAALEVVETDGRAHRARSNFTVVRIMESGGMAVFACGEYLDRIVETGRGLRFAERLAVCDSRTVDTLLAIPL